MSSRDLVRAGLVLLGALLIVNTLSSVVGAVTARPMMIQVGPGFEMENLGTVSPPFDINLVVALAIGLGPGILLIYQSDAWSRAWLPGDEAEARAEIGSDGIFAVSLMLVGLYLGIKGLANLLGGGLMLLFSGIDDHSGGVWAGGINIGVSGVFFAGGIVLFAWGHHLARGPEDEGDEVKGADDDA